MMRAVEIYKVNNSNKKTREENLQAKIIVNKSFQRYYGVGRKKNTTKKPFSPSFSDDITTDSANKLKNEKEEAVKQYLDFEEKEAAVIEDLQHELLQSEPISLRELEKLPLLSSDKLRKEDVDRYLRPSLSNNKNNKNKDKNIDKNYDKNKDKNKDKNDFKNNDNNDFKNENKFNKNDKKNFKNKNKEEEEFEEEIRKEEKIFAKSKDKKNKRKFKEISIEDTKDITEEIEVEEGDEDLLLKYKNDLDRDFQFDFEFEKELEGDEIKEEYVEGDHPSQRNIKEKVNKDKENKEKEEGEEEEGNEEFDEEFEEEDEREHPQEDIGLSFRHYSQSLYSNKDKEKNKDQTADANLDQTSLPPSSPPSSSQSKKKKFLLNDDENDFVDQKKKEKKEQKLGDDEREGMKGEEEEEESEELKAFRKRKEQVLQSDKKKFPHFTRDYTKCRGCGIRLQSEREGELGFVPKYDRKKSRKKKRLCQRCFYLRYHNGEPPSLLSSEQSKILQSSSSASQLLSSNSSTNSIDENQENNDNNNVRMIAPQIESYREAVAKDVEDYLKEILPSRKCVVVHLFDLSDQNPESFLSNINKTVGTNPVHYVGTKFDLLPHGASIARIRSWFHSLIESFTGNKVPISHVHVVSSVSGQNVKSTILEIDNFRKGRDVFVVGCVNSGKSTFINSALLHLGIGGVKYDKRFGITTSRVPGTTLDAITLPLKTGGYLHDTPGLQIYSSVPSLTADEAKLSLISKQIKPILLHVREGKSIYFGGLGRIDYLKGPAMHFAIFSSRRMRIHVGEVDDANSTQQKYVGKSLVPPLLSLSSSSTPMIDYRLIGDHLFDKLNENRKIPLPPYTINDLDVHLDDWEVSPNQSICDIVLPGVGWASITMSVIPTIDHILKFRGLCMHPQGAFIRKSIMPFEGTKEGIRHIGVTRYSQLPSISIPYIKLPNIPKDAQDLPLDTPFVPLKKKMTRKDRMIKKEIKQKTVLAERRNMEKIKQEVLKENAVEDLDEEINGDNVVVIGGDDRVIIEEVENNRE